MQGCDSPEDLFGKHGRLESLTKRVVEHALLAELTEHLGYEPHAPEGRETGNTRNGTTATTVQTENGARPLRVPRNRGGSFEPTLVKTRPGRLEGFDEKVLVLYARGLTTREIQGHLEELYGGEVSPTLIATITDAVFEDVRAWQSRPVEEVYPILYVDGLFGKSHQDGMVKPKAVALALGVTLQGEQELLGLWVSDTEGAKFWLGVCTELHPRGMQDCFVACVDGLSGLPEAVETVFLHSRSNSGLCIRSDSRCGTWSGKSGDWWRGISGPSLGRPRYTRPRPPSSN